MPILFKDRRFQEADYVLIMHALFDHGVGFSSETGRHHAFVAVERPLSYSNNIEPDVSTDVSQTEMCLNIDIAHRRSANDDHSSRIMMKNSVHLC